MIHYIKGSYENDSVDMVLILLSEKGEVNRAKKVKRKYNKSEF